VPLPLAAAWLAAFAARANLALVTILIGERHQLAQLTARGAGVA
jgi:hypothetical protein